MCVFRAETLGICSKLLRQYIFSSWCALLPVEVRVNIPGADPGLESTGDREGWGVKQKMIWVIKKTH